MSQPRVPSFPFPAKTTGNCSFLGVRQLAAALHIYAHNSCIFDENTGKYFVKKNPTCLYYGLTLILYIF
jgi:hypothetical protein